MFDSNKLEQELTWKDEDPLLHESKTRAVMGDALIHALEQIEDEEAKQRLSGALWSDPDGGE